MKHLTHLFFRFIFLSVALVAAPLAAAAATQRVGVEHVQSADGNVKLYLKTTGDTPVAGGRIRSRMPHPGASRVSHRLRNPLAPR